MAAMAGLRLPIESHLLQAFVTEGLKPVIDTVISFGMGHYYISQSDKGGLVFGGDMDFYASYAQRGNLPRAEQVTQAAMTLMPMIGKARVLRSWGRDHGHVARWLAHHRQNPYRRIVPECGLVLWRVQGGARLGLGFCPPDRHRPTP